jgi:hypothetical protein
LGKSQFKFSPGKQFSRPHLQNNQKDWWSGSVVPGLPTKCKGPEFKPLYCKKKKKKPNIITRMKCTGDVL